MRLFACFETMPKCSKMDVLGDFTQIDKTSILRELKKFVYSHVLKQCPNAQKWMF
jgi:hypothetical protein